MRKTIYHPNFVTTLTYSTGMLKGFENNVFSPEICFYNNIIILDEKKIKQKCSW